MSNTSFQFKRFKIFQYKTAMKVGADSVLLGSLSSFNKPELILDIGTGTGLLAFMAVQRTNADIVAVEIEENAYEQCKENVSYNNMQEKIEVIHTSFQNYYKSTKKKFDHIICNPPFFENSFKPIDKRRNIARHNTTLKPSDLFSGVSNIISDKGIFSLIISAENFENYMHVSNQNNIHCFNIIKVFPKTGKDVHRYILEFSKEKRKQLSRKISIREQNSNQYTEQYKKITKDFYLNLSE